MIVPRYHLRDFMSEPGWAANNSSASGSYGGAIDPLYGGAPGQSQPIGFFPHATIIEVRSSGQVYEVPGVGYFYGYKWGPAGWIGSGGAAYPNAAMGLTLTSGTGGTNWWVSANPADSSSTIDTIRIDAGVSINGVRADAIRDVEPGDATHCGPHGYAPCRTWAGEASISFTRLHSDLTLSPTIVPEAAPDTLVTFTAGATPGSIKGYAVDISELRWRWEPKYRGGDSTACESMSGTSCTHRMRGPGRMIVAAYVNGEAQQRTTAGLEIHNLDSMGVQLAGAPLPKKCSDDSAFKREHPEIANPVMDSVLKMLWKKAKYSPDSLYFDRREVGGWILKINDSTYGFKEYDAVSTACNVYDRNPTPPASALWEIHVHPFHNGQPLNACQSKRYMTDTIRGIYMRHRSGTSGEAIPATSPEKKDSTGDYGALARYTAMLGREIKGINIDADSIVTYQLSDLDPMTGRPRRDTTRTVNNHFPLLDGKKYRRCSY